MRESVHQKPVAPRIDRRAVRTRTRLKQALLDLMRQKPYVDISVEEVSTLARVGRSTFYLHYAGKDDLKRRGFEEHLRLELTTHAAATDHLAQAPFAFSLPILRHASARLPLYRRLNGGPGEPLGFQTIETVVRQAIATDLKARPKPRVDASSELVAFLTGAFMAMLREWLEGGALADVAVIDAAYRKLASGALAAADNR